jgi:uroporphyrinogen-III synthase
MTILFTRSIDETAKNRLKASNIDVFECNVLTINALPTALDDILNAFADFKNLVFTSQHAVRIFCDILNENHIVIPPSVCLFSTSGETKNVIKKYGYYPTLTADAAEPLAHLMLEKADISGGVHFICGTLSLPILPRILTENNITLHKIMVYETLTVPPPPNEAIMPLSQATSFDAVVFFSLSAAGAFLMTSQLLNPTIVFTLGKTTAEYVRNKTGINTIFTAEKPTIESLIDTIIRIIAPSGGVGE